MNRMTESENAIGSKNTYTYNAQGLLAQSKNARNQSTVYTYDALGRITSATDELGTISYTYDANGNILTVTDENNHTATREYDCMNRVTKYTDYRGNTVKYGYDTTSSVSSIRTLLRETLPTAQALTAMLIVRATLSACLTRSD